MNGMAGRMTWVRGPVVCAVIAVAAQGMWASLREAQTWDEAYAVAAGYLHAETGRYELVFENPPLLGLLVHPPLKLAGARTPVFPDATLARMSPVVYGKHFFYRAGNDHRTLLILARSMVLLVTLVAVGLVVFWAGRLHGKRGAWLAASLCALEPNWLAHGHIAAWDGLATSTLTIATFATVVFLDRPTYPRAAVVGLCTGLAWSAKHTALLLWPFFGVILLLSSPLAGRHRLVPTGEAGAAFPLRRLLIAFAVIVATGLLVVGASYDFSFRYGLYAESISGIYRLGRTSYENFLCGEFRAANFPHYYLVALALKTPVGFLPLLPIGLAGAVRSGRRSTWAPAAIMVGLILTATAFNPHNLAIRHVVPAIPFFIVLASGALAPMPSSKRWSGIVAAFICACVAAGAVESLRRTPDHIAFFNFAAGGPAEGIRCLDDSNIDWGQDLRALAELQREEQIENLVLLYFGSAEPAAWGVAARPMSNLDIANPRPDTVYAVSVHTLNRLPRRLGPQADWLRRYRPWRIAGDSIYLYRFPEGDAAPPD
jgi:hypothetical protein